MSMPRPRATALTSRHCGSLSAYANRTSTSAMSRRRCSKPICTHSACSAECELARRREGTWTELTKIEQVHKDELRNREVARNQVMMERGSAPAGCLNRSVATGGELAWL